ncbi:hypothetical protein Q757_06420 [Oenococcus alcoholitolerans]|uniref:Uncharacterized protein n=1 Tax=Oenococcus alcoholitolerans TaxID=931074 RepID=A0ABR4XQ25_9LACO|nr:hypothetical protein Q757_06420 [Oenococcus alcoholitolerans]
MIGLQSKKIEILHRRIMDLRTGQQKNLPIEDYQKKFNLINVASFVGLVISSDVLKQIGLPRYDLFSQFDDTDYSLKISQNTPIVNVSSALIRHPEFPQTKYTANWKTYYALRNEQIVLKEYFSKSAYHRLLRRRKFEFIKCCLKGLFVKRSRVWAKIRYDALADGKQNRVGINKKYLP